MRNLKKNYREGHTPHALDPDRSRDTVGECLIFAENRKSKFQKTQKSAKEKNEKHSA